VWLRIGGYGEEEGEPRWALAAGVALGVGLGNGLAPEWAQTVARGAGPGTLAVEWQALTVDQVEYWVEWRVVAMPTTGSATTEKSIRLRGSTLAQSSGAPRALLRGLPPGSQVRLVVGARIPPPRAGSPEVRLMGAWGSVVDVPDEVATEAVEGLAEAPASPDCGLGVAAEGATSPIFNFDALLDPWAHATGPLTPMPAKAELEPLARSGEAFTAKLEGTLDSTAEVAPVVVVAAEASIPTDSGGAASSNMNVVDEGGLAALGQAISDYPAVDGCGQTEVRCVGKSPPSLRVARTLLVSPGPASTARRVRERASPGELRTVRSKLDGLLMEASADVASEHVTDIVTDSAVIESELRQLVPYQQRAAQRHAPFDFDQDYDVTESTFEVIAPTPHRELNMTPSPASSSMRKQVATPLSKADLVPKSCAITITPLVGSGKLNVCDGASPASSKEKASSPSSAAKLDRQTKLKNTVAHTPLGESRRFEDAAGSMRSPAMRKSTTPPLSALKAKLPSWAKQKTPQTASTTTPTPSPVERRLTMRQRLDVLLVEAGVEVGTHDSTLIDGAKRLAETVGVKMSSIVAVIEQAEEAMFGGSAASAPYQREIHRRATRGGA